MTTTLIRRAAFVVAWDLAAATHKYLREADVAFADDRIVFVGSAYHGAADVVIDGRDVCVLPGLINLHCHPFLEPIYRGVREEHGVPAMHMTGLYERSQAFRADEAAMVAAAEVGYCELLLSGVTAICDQVFPFPGWLELVARSGLRAFVAPGFASARWRLEDGHRLVYDWDEAGGRRGLDAALTLIDEAEADPCGRLSGVVFPLQIDTCTQDLLADSAAAAATLNRPLTTHAAQAVDEVLEITRRTGRTPIAWASEVGFLGPRTTLGHALFVDDHSWINGPGADDVRLLAESGTSVAHCPSPFARYGHVFEHFGRYRNEGVNLGIGTDVSPHNMLEEMRLATTLGRIAARDVTAVNLADVFHAATIGGATALLRDDIGRIAPGAKADLVLVDLTNPYMRPARDPLRSLVYHAAERAVRDVYVDGIQRVRDGRVLSLDWEAALDALAEGQARMLRDAGQHDFLGRTADEIAPLTLVAEDRS